MGKLSQLQKIDAAKRAEQLENVCGWKDESNQGSGIKRIKLQRDRTAMGICILSLVRILFGYVLDPGSNGFD